MQISDVIIGILTFIAVSFVTLAMVSDMYAPGHYDVDLEHGWGSNYTSELSGFQKVLNDSQKNVTDAAFALHNKVPGEPDAEGATLTDVQKSSLLSITNVGTFISATTGLINSVAKSLGIDQQGIVVMYFVLGLLVSVALTILGIVFFRAL